MRNAAGAAASRPNACTTERMGEWNQLPTATPWLPLGEAKGGELTHFPFNEQLSCGSWRAANIRPYGG